MLHQTWPSPISHQEERGPRKSVASSRPAANCIQSRNSNALSVLRPQKRIFFSASLRPLAPLPVGPLYPSLSIYPPPIFLAPTPSLSSVPLFAGHKSPFPEHSHKVSPCLSLPWALLDCVARLCANHHDLLLHSPLARVAGHHQIIVQQNMIMMNFNIMNSNMINSNMSLQKVAARSAWPGVLLLRAALTAPQLLQVRSISTPEEFWIFRIDCM